MAQPKYQLLQQWLRDQINSGEYTANQQIPTELELAEQFGYSRQTIRQAISGLEQEGLLKRTPGRGTFVCQQNAGRVNRSESRTRRVGVLTTYLDDYIFPGIINGIEHKQLTLDEANGLLRVITDYTYGLDTLDKYDFQQLEVVSTTPSREFRATYEEAMGAIHLLQEKFGSSDLFGNEKDQSFKSSINTHCFSCSGAASLTLIEAIFFCLSLILRCLLLPAYHNIPASEHKPDSDEY